MPDNAAVFLGGARQKTRHINKGHDWNTEGIAESDETCRLDRRLNVETPGKHHGLIGHDANSRTAHAAEPDQNIACKVRFKLKEITVVDDFGDELMHVIRLVWIIRDQSIQGRFRAVHGIHRLPLRRLVDITRGQKIDKAAQAQKRLDVVIKRTIRDARPARVRSRPAEFFMRHRFVRDGLYNLGTRDIHVGGIPHHKDKVGDGRRVNGPACTRTHDHGDLRNHA